VPGDPVPAKFIEAACNPEWLALAYTDQFERLIEQHILAPRYGWPLIPIEQHRCLQASTLAHALPGSLENAAAALGLVQQKDRAGRRLMLEMSKPRKPRKGEDPSGIYWLDDMGRRTRLGEYCKQDVATERDLYKRVGTLRDGEQALWLLDQKINDRGIYIDRQLLEGAIRITTEAKRAHLEEFKKLSAGTLQSANQIKRLITWFAEEGFEIPNAQKKTLEQALLQQPDLPANVRAMIEQRLGVAHAAAAKPSKILDWLNPDDRARGTLIFHGAHTGRWSSKGIQIQNMKKPAKGTDLNAAIADVSSGDYQHLRQKYPQPISIVGDTSRALLRAAPGHRLIAADFSGIESRVTAWLSGQQSKLDQWAKFDQTGKEEDEPYYIIGLKTFGMPVTHARTGGKTGDLAFGFMGSIPAWKKFAPPGDKTTDPEIICLRDAWRKAHPQTTRFWKSLEVRALLAVKNPGKVYTTRRISFVCESAFLFMHLPSGRRLAYPSPKIGTGSKFNNPVVVYMSAEKGRWTECRGGEGAYGATWIENAVQAFSRDLFAAAMPRLEAAGYRIVIHVHDEIIAEVADGFGGAEEFRQLLIECPEWATGLPLNAKVREGPRFCKIEKPAVAAHFCAQCHLDPPDGTEHPSAYKDLWLHARCEDAFIRTRMAEEGLAESVAKPELATASAAEPPPWEDTGEAPPSPQPKPMHGFQWEEDAFKNYTASHGGGRIVDQYIYEDTGGRPYLRVNRTTKHKFFQEYWGEGKWVLGKPAGGPIPYRLPQLLAAKPDEVVVIAEGEKDADTAVNLGFIATCNPGGAGKFTAELAPWLHGKEHVIICEDNDDAGRQHVIKVTAALHGKVPDIRIARFTDLPNKGADLSDWAAMGYTREDLLARATPAPEPTVEAIRASEIEQTAVEWVWPDRFAVGKLGIIAGLPDVGKGLLFNFIMAIITQGAQWPCGEGTAPQGNVLLLTAEDDLSDTVVPRLIAAGANRERIQILKMVPTNVNGRDGKRMFSLVTDLHMLRQKIQEMGAVRAVLIDPLTAYLGVKQIDSFRTTDVRAVLAPLVEMATEMRVLILVIMHFNKKIDVTNVLLRISDSLAFGATSRHCYAVVDDAENRRTLMVKGKNNLAPKDQKALAFSVNVRNTGTDRKTGKPITAPYITFSDEYVDVTASEAMQAASESKAPTTRNNAKVFLEDLLAGNPMESTEVEEAGEANGISRRTLFRAKAELKIRAIKDGPVKDGQRTWRWHLPT
jgi:DNA polymerase